MNPQESQLNLMTDENMAQQPDNIAMQNEIGDSKASLAFSNMLRENIFNQQNPMMPEQGMEGEQPQQEMSQAPQQEAEEPQEEENNESEMLEKKMEDKLEILRTEMKDTIKTEIGSIRDEIKNALENEQD